MANLTKEQLKAQLLALEAEEKKAQRREVVSTPKETDVIAEFGGKAPLKRETSQGGLFPIDALNATMQKAVWAGCRKLNCSEGLMAQSILASSALAVQGLFNVRSPDNRVTTSNEFFFTVADSGRGKTEVMDVAMQGHERYKADLRRRWREWRDEKQAFEDNPENKGMKFQTPEPWRGLYILEEPTYESLTRMQRQPMAGLFSDEGGRMLNGFSMSGEQAIKTAAGFCDLWSSKKPIRRSRVSEGDTELYHRRVSVHLLIQEKVAVPSFLASETMKSQGFIPRFLMCAPKEPEYVPMVGRTFEDNDDIQRKINNFADCIYALMERVTYNLEFELNTFEVEIDHDAFHEWCKFKDEIMIALQSNEQYEDIPEIAIRMPEHCQRLAVILQAVEHPMMLSISKEYMLKAIKLSRFYLAEAERLLQTSIQSKYERALIDSADKLLKWLKSEKAAKYYVDDAMPHVAIYKNGPSGLRSANTAMKACTVLVNHGHIKLKKVGRSKYWEVAK